LRNHAFPARSHARAPRDETLIVEQSSSAEPRRHLRRYIKRRFIDPLRQMPASRISQGIKTY
jgi:hypothetical protein